MHMSEYATHSLSLSLSLPWSHIHMPMPMLACNALVCTYVVICDTARRSQDHDSLKHTMTVPDLNTRDVACICLAADHHGFDAVCDAWGDQVC